jgi:hypothetical protein
MAASRIASPNDRKILLDESVSRRIGITDTGEVRFERDKRAEQNALNITKYAGLKSPASSK